MGNFKRLAAAGTCFAISTFATAAYADTGQQEQAGNGQQSSAAQANPSAASVQTSPAGEEATPPDRIVQNSQDVEPGRSVVPTPASDDTDRARFEVGILPSYTSNFFEAQDEFGSSTATPTPDKSVFIATLSASFDYDIIKSAQSKLTADVRLRSNLVRGLDGANSTDIDASLTFSSGPNQFKLGYFGTPRRLVSIDPGGNTYGEVEGFSAEYMRQLSKRWRARASYVFARDTFTTLSERDLSVHQFRGDVRYKLTPLFMPGVGFEYRRAIGNSEKYSYKRPALLLTVTSEISDVAYLSFRYRYSDRTYTTDVATVSNFGREDHRDEFSFYGTVQLGHGFSLFGFADHLKNRSSVIYDNFRNDDAGLGVFFRF